MSIYRNNVQIGSVATEDTSIASTTSAVTQGKMYRNYSEVYKIYRNGNLTYRKVENEKLPRVQQTNEIWYTSTDGNIITPHSTSVYGANIISNTYIDDIGVITFDGDVIRVGEDAFSGCTTLATITLPNTVQNLGSDSFRYCTNLSEITIPSTVYDIGGESFSYCRSLSTVDLPNCITEIKYYLFARCFGLDRIIIPSGVTRIGDAAFYNCSALTEITVLSTTPPTLASDSLTYTNDCPILVPSASVETYKAARGWSNYANRIHQIEPTPPSNEIWYTSSDGNIITPYIHASWYGVNIVSNTYVDGKGVITFDGPVTHYDYAVFNGCTRLTSMIIPSGVTDIGTEVFCNCTALTSISMSNNVTYIGPTTFSDCISLSSITLSNSLSNIWNYLFWGCTSLTSITIPSSITRIRTSSFYNCTALTSITVESLIPPTLDTNAFTNTSDCPIYVPSTSVDAYKTATNWSEYASRIQAMPE